MNGKWLGELVIGAELTFLKVFSVLQALNQLLFTTNITLLYLYYVTMLEWTFLDRLGATLSLVFPLPKMLTLLLQSSILLGQTGLHRLGPLELTWLTPALQPPASPLLPPPSLAPLQNTIPPSSRPPPAAGYGDKETCHFCLHDLHGYALPPLPRAPKDALELIARVISVFIRVSMEYQGLCCFSRLPSQSFS